jgi:hypothetical protein
LADDEDGSTVRKGCSLQYILLGHWIYMYGK